MIYLALALYCEAQPLIEYLHLKKEITSHKFQVFTNGRIKLIITNTGSLNAAIALTWLFTKEQPSSEDILINIGTCGMENELGDIGDIWIGNKIIEDTTKRSYYPDILYRHPFGEATIITRPAVANIEYHNIIKREISKGKLAIYDMEASGIYQGGGLFLQTHQMCFLKIVSDYLDKDRFAMEDVLLIMKNCCKVIGEWIMKLEYRPKTKVIVFSKDELCIIEEISGLLNMTITMRNQLEHLLYYNKLKEDSQVTIDSLLNEVREMPYKTKVKGKKYLETLREQLL